MSELSYMFYVARAMLPLVAPLVSYCLAKLLMEQQEAMAQASYVLLADLQWSHDTQL